MPATLGLNLDDDASVREGAGFWIRALARAIDTLVHVGVGFMAALAAAILIGIGSALQGTAPDAALEKLAVETHLGALAGLLGNTAMHTVAEGLHGSTLGKRICGLTVIAENGQPATVIAALKRSVAFLLDALFFGVVGARKMSESPANQRHGDVWAQTLVVRLSSIETSARPSWIRFVLVIAAALSLDLVLIFIELGAKLSYAP